MNRQSLPPQVNPPYTNGHYETPLEASGVSLHRPATVQSPTVFPTDLPLRGLGPLLYAMQRFQVGGLPVARYIGALWLLVAIAAIVGILPGRWLTAGIACVLWLGQLFISQRYSRRQFVDFDAAPVPHLTHAPLETSEKLPIYATGLLGVEGRNRFFSVLPGFYRTFATGEHAMLCRVAERTWLGVSSWPEDETGMWYAFVNPSDIEQLAWGRLGFGNITMPALAIQYRLELAAGPRRKKAEIRQETLYLATPQVEDAQRIFVDLLTNVPADKIVTRITTP